MIKAKLLLLSCIFCKLNENGDVHVMLRPHAFVKLVSHWEATISRLVGDKGLRYKRDFLPFFTLR